MVIDHGNGLTTTYAHFLYESNPPVKVGDVVNTDKQIGRMGSSGFSTGAHLHFEVRIDGQSKDPKKYLGREFTNLNDEEFARACSINGKGGVDLPAYPTITKEEAKNTIAHYINHYTGDDTVLENSENTTWTEKTKKEVTQGKEQDPYNDIKNYIILKQECGVYYYSLQTITDSNNNWSGYDGIIVANPYKTASGEVQSFLIKNGIWDKYTAEGRMCGVIGVPKTEEQNAGVKQDSKAYQNQAWLQRFERRQQPSNQYSNYTNNSIYAYESNEGFKAHFVVNEVANQYESKGGTWSEYGFPTGDTYPGNQNPRWCKQWFEGGMEMDLCEYNIDDTEINIDEIADNALESYYIEIEEGVYNKPEFHWSPGEDNSRTYIENVRDEAGNEHSYEIYDVFTGGLNEYFGQVTMTNLSGKDVNIKNEYRLIGDSATGVFAGFHLKDRDTGQIYRMNDCISDSIHFTINAGECILELENDLIVSGGEVQKTFDIYGGIKKRLQMITWGPVTNYHDDENVFPRKGDYLMIRQFSIGGSDTKSGAGNILVKVGYNAYSPDGYMPPLDKRNGNNDIYACYNEDKCFLPMKDDYGYISTYLMTGACIVSAFTIPPASPVICLISTGLDIYMEGEFKWYHGIDIAFTLVAVPSITSKIFKGGSKATTSSAKYANLVARQNNFARPTLASAMITQEATEHITIRKGSHLIDDAIRGGTDDVARLVGREMTDDLVNESVKRMVNGKSVETKFLNKLGIKKADKLNDIHVHRPELKDINSQTWKNIVGLTEEQIPLTPKRGDYKGIIFDGYNPNTNTLYEIKYYTEPIPASYQIKVEMYFAKTNGKKYVLATKNGKMTDLTTELQTLVKNNSDFVSITKIEI